MATFVRHVEPVPPSGWNEDDKHYHMEIMSVFDEIYSWRGRLTLKDFLPSELKKIGLLVYPVGAIFYTTGEESPADLYGGEWKKIENKEWGMSWEAADGEEEEPPVIKYRRLK